MLRLVNAGVNAVKQSVAYSMFENYYVPKKKDLKKAASSLSGLGVSDSILTSYLKYAGLFTFTPGVKLLPNMQSLQR